MEILIFALCIVAGYKIYTFAIRPFLVAAGIVRD